MVRMTGLLIVLLAWFLAGALVTAMIIWPACVIAGRVGRENANAKPNLAKENTRGGEG